jgi:hypothetical protein
VRTTERLKEVVAFLYNRSGKDEMTAQELRLAMAMDLRWFTPKEAEEVVDLFQNKRLVTKGAGGGLRPTFNYGKLSLPRDFRPSTDLLRRGGADEEPLFVRMVGHVAVRSDNEKRHVIALINRKAGELGVEVEAAAMLVGAEMGVAMAPFADEALAAITAKAHPPEGQAPP